MTLMVEGWEPRRVGKRPRVDARPMLAKLNEHPGRWVSWTMSPEDARSARGQLIKHGVDVAVERIPNADTHETSAVLYARMD